MLDNQQIFDAVAVHLSRGERAVTEDEACFYRMRDDKQEHCPTGFPCAVGLFIRDEDYHPLMDKCESGGNISAIWQEYERVDELDADNCQEYAAEVLMVEALEKNIGGMSANLVDFLAMLQECHDATRLADNTETGYRQQRETTRSHLLCIAEFCNLNTNLVHALY